MPTKNSVAHPISVSTTPGSLRFILDGEKPTSVFGSGADIPIGEMCKEMFVGVSCIGANWSVSLTMRNGLGVSGIGCAGHGDCSIT